MTTKRLLTALLAVLALAACGDDGTGPDDDGTPASLVGRYILETAYGEPVPVVLRDDSVKVTLNSGFYNLNNDQTFTYGYAYTVVRNGASTPETDTGLGFWDQNKGALFLDYGDGFPDAGTVVGRNLYMTAFGGIPYVFRRQ